MANTWFTLAPSCASLALMVSVLAAGSPAAEFRIETQVWNDQAEPVLLGSNLTLFRDGTVYDFVEDPPRVALFKRNGTAAGGRFVLLDPQARQRSEVTTARISEILASLRAWSALQQDPLLQFGQDPVFEERRDDQIIELSHDTIQYRIQLGIISDKQTLDQYRAFTDWYTRLNAVIAPSYTLPAIRMAVNKAIYHHRSLPLRVQLAIPPHGKQRPERIARRAEHEIIWRLSSGDRRRIEQVERQLVNFAEVPFERYAWQPEKVANKQ